MTPSRSRKPARFSGDGICGFAVRSSQFNVQWKRRLRPLPPFSPRGQRLEPSLMFSWFGFNRFKEAPIVGVALAVLFACEVGVLIQRKLLRLSIPFILLGSFGFLYCGLVTLGRAEGGISETLLRPRPRPRGMP